MSGPYREPWRPSARQPRLRAAKSAAVVGCLCTLAGLALGAGLEIDARTAVAMVAGGVVGVGLSLALRALGALAGPGE